MKIRTRRDEYIQIRPMNEKEGFELGTLTAEGVRILELTEKELKEFYRELRELVRFAKL